MGGKENKGVQVVEPLSQIDHRGSFCKYFDWVNLKQRGIDFTVAEGFWSSSRKNTIRGLHFQESPHDCEKIVTVLSGLVLDVQLNLETGKTHFKYLTGEHPMCVYIPKGYAHGFKAETDCTILYLQNRRFSVYHDAGVHYTSADAPWDCDDPILSERDKSLPKYEDYCNRT